MNKIINQYGPLINWPALSEKLGVPVSPDNIPTEYRYAVFALLMAVREWEEVVEDGKC